MAAWPGKPDETHAIVGSQMEGAKMNKYDTALTLGTETIRRAKALKEILDARNDTYLRAHKMEYLEHIAVCESYLEGLKEIAEE